MDVEIKRLLMYPFILSSGIFDLIYRFGILLIPILNTRLKVTSLEDRKTHNKKFT